MPRRGGREGRRHEGRGRSGCRVITANDRPGIVRVFCDIHSHMNAFILVFSHPFFAVTDAEGRYRLETILPAEYPGRARHIHVKVQPPGGRVLTTQLYFPNQPGNQRDGLFTPDLVMHMPNPGQGAFDFVVA